MLGCHGSRRSAATSSGTWCRREEHIAALGGGRACACCPWRLVEAAYLGGVHIAVKHSDDRIVTVLQHNAVLAVDHLDGDVVPERRVPGAPHHTVGARAEVPAREHVGPAANCQIVESRCGLDRRHGAGAEGQAPNSALLGAADAPPPLAAERQGRRRLGLAHSREGEERQAARYERAL